ncbi:LuxE/PaaK family acyltransferase [Chondromyces apiculatus]|uniref:Putative acyl protein synthase/acyl-CoA reductase-like protein n=1 Tax=Chondromyces apiculatus DSM 436 TaxID=1192034 RepID=A0A017SZZ1_9BACT|nr:acyl-protein synthetase [Chondromyces apiculatus]EYF02337.1 putative acyl protein synthase/acyl-CoA reductase-like protein [Chondromyces apiculatus DSM 436]
MGWLEESDALHARVQDFIAATGGGSMVAQDDFDTLATEIARYQAAYCAPVRRLFQARGTLAEVIATAAHIPAVPTDAFRFTRVAVHPREADAWVFRTSGTSLGPNARGEHPLRTAATYEIAALTWGAKMMWPDRKAMRVMVLAPPLSDAPDSSLSFMLDRFATHLGGHASWHFRAHGSRAELDSESVGRACGEAWEAGEPVLVLGTSFAFVHLLESCPKGSTRLPEGSRVMQTGGFKGRSREVEASTLRAEIASLFGIPEPHVIGEYGMTELSSQMYEETLAASLRDGHAAPGIYLPPPWMRVTAVDPVTLAALPEGELGLARIVDLANVDSAVAIQTADRVRVTGASIELLGRAPGATPRGCSLALDEMLGGSS